MAGFLTNIANAIDGSVNGKLPDFGITELFRAADDSNVDLVPSVGGNEANRQAQVYSP